MANRSGCCSSGRCSEATTTTTTTTSIGVPSRAMEGEKGKKRTLAMISCSRCLGRSFKERRLQTTLGLQVLQRNQGSEHIWRQRSEPVVPQLSAQYHDCPISFLSSRCRGSRLVLTSQHNEYHSFTRAMPGDSTYRLVRFVKKRNTSGGNESRSLSHRYLSMANHS